MVDEGGGQRVIQEGKRERGGTMAKVKGKKRPRSYVAGLFDVDERLTKLSLLGDPLVELKRLIDWAAFRGEIEQAREKAREHARKSAAGAKPNDAVLMFKTLNASWCCSRLLMPTTIRFIGWTLC